MESCLDWDLNCLQVPLQSYILFNYREKRATAKNPCLNLCSFQCHSHREKIFMFLKTLEHSVSHCLTSLLTHLLYFQTSCLHFFPSCLPSRHMPTPPPLSQGASLCLVYSSSCGSFGNSSDGNSCDKQDFLWILCSSIHNFLSWQLDFTIQERSALHEI